MPADAQVAAWRPGVPGVTEVFHAHFTDHRYPMHTHDAWTLLIVDDGAVRFDLDHHEHGVTRSLVTLLPPHVPHDGRAATPRGFGKRVLYLEPELLEERLIGAAVDRPALADPLLRTRIGQLHEVLRLPGDELEAQSRLALVRERLNGHLRHDVTAPPASRDPAVARRLRRLLDERAPQGLSLDEAARILQVHPTHLVRSFSRAYGMPPHLYLTGRRVDLARRLLLAGRRPAEVAVAAGFYDQPHLTRVFRRTVGVSPARYAGGRPGRQGSDTAC
ncbi:helix-turn-helix transcriptional regulator [Actinomadura rugatobispora]|uniref:AraC family transcriptional regulator n=1 Tax=Actinomadura rugatobispora TaxID=1994 RepID=A0ABW1A314_9ACTN|nr:AraC family transcriptional regulator [Actinomadura rugatobispora]